MSWPSSIVNMWMKYLIHIISIQREARQQVPLCCFSLCVFHCFCERFYFPLAPTFILVFVINALFKALEASLCTNNPSLSFGDNKARFCFRAWLPPLAKCLLHISPNMVTSKRKQNYIFVYKPVHDIMMAAFTLMVIKQMC